MADELQHRLGGAFQAAVERYASDRDEAELEIDEQQTGKQSSTSTIIS